MTPSNPVGDVRSADLDLVGRIRSGDGAAFEALYRQHATRLYNLASRMIGAQGEADDLLQDIFLLAYRKIGSFRGESSLGTWLYRLAMNQLLDHVRSRAARTGQVTDGLEDAGLLADTSSHRLADRAINRLDLERAVGELPEGCRAAFVLHDVQGLEHKEVAQALGIAEGTSKSQVHKARLRLRTLLAASTRAGR